jgi:hypothetical protein
VVETVTTLMTAIGEPLGARLGAGGWDFFPLLLAAVFLLVLRVVLGVRLRWQLVLAVVLLAPLVRAIGDRVGMPLTLAVVLAATWVVVLAARSARPPQPGPTRV